MYLLFLYLTCHYVITIVKRLKRNVLFSIMVRFLNKTFSFLIFHIQPQRKATTHLSIPLQRTRHSQISLSLSHPHTSLKFDKSTMICCFGCSSESRTKKKDKSDVMGDLRLDTEADDQGNGNEEILTDYRTFSLKEQQRMLKKAQKEEAKASREAEKVMEWVKQASARIDATVIDELLAEERKMD